MILKDLHATLSTLSSSNTILFIGHIFRDKVVVTSSAAGQKESVYEYMSSIIQDERK
jgi:hypothetical protein